VSLRILEAAIETEQSDQLHEARLLLLLRHAATRGEGTVAGITKLAKLDFLLRYPMYFQRIVDSLNKSRKRKIKLDIERHEMETVESKMIRFRYGPWDPRYRRWIGILVAKGLADTYLKGRTVHVKLTNEGLQLAESLANNESMKDLDIRSQLIDKTVGSKSGEWLKNTVYEVVPELSGMAWINP